MDERKPNIPRLTSFSLPLRCRGSNYILYKYLFRDLKVAFDKFVKEHDHVFDIGCGNKPFEPYIRSIIGEKATKSYRGCDIVQSSEQKVDIICEATDIPESDCIYDVVICTQVIEHVFDHAKIFKEANRLLKPGGFFIVSSALVWQIHEAPFDFFRFTKYGFRQLLQDAGFIVKEELTNGGTWAVIGQMLCYLISTRKSGGFYLVRIYRAAIRRVLLALCNTIFLRLVKRHYDEALALNYVFVGQKI